MDIENGPLVIRHEKCMDPLQMGCQNMVKNPIFQDILTFYDPRKTRWVEEIKGPCLKCFKLANKVSKSPIPKPKKFESKI